MRPRFPLLIAFFAATACAGGAADQASPVALTPEHAAAMRDSVTKFMDAFANDISAPPMGMKVREAMGRFYAADMLMTTDLAPDMPLFVQTLDSLVPPGEVVSQQPGIKGSRFEWNRRTITPLAPGLATYSAIYTEHVTDTTGVTTDIPGAQQAVLRNGPTGWRIVAIQSAHPLSAQQRMMELNARLAPKP